MIETRKILFRLTYTLIFLVVIFLFLLMNKNMFLLVKEYKIIKLAYNIMKKYDEKDYHLDSKVILSVNKYIKEYKESGVFQKGVENRAKHIKMIQSTFKKYNLPPELAFAAFTGSNFEPAGVNEYADTKGLWALTPVIAKRYGLKNNDRFNPEKETEAAAKYFSDLLSIYGQRSIFLALASHYAGEDAIGYGFALIKKEKDKTFWHMYNYNLFSQETKEYILKTIALMILDENPDIKI
jgi:hypothetical protein